MKILFIFMLFLFVGCSPTLGSSFLYSSQSLTQGASSFLENESFVALNQDQIDNFLNQMACSNFESEYWEHIYVTLFNNSPPPPLAVVQKEVIRSAQRYVSQIEAQPSEVRKFFDLISALYKGTFEFFADKSKELILIQLSEIDSLVDSGQGYDDSIDSSTVFFVEEIAPLFEEFKETIRSLNLKCQRREPISSSRFDQNFETPLLAHMKQSLHPLVYGSRKVMMVSYQSCDVLNMPLVPEGYSGLSGISEQSSGNRTVRNISSLRQLQNSHYYLKNLRQPARQCFNIKKSPLIYDYGGKPYVTQYPFPTINLFKNAGSGSESLGIDCSGFVLTAMASAGLRAQENKDLKGVHISGLSSFNFRKPAERLNCFRMINSSYSSPLLSGDVIASLGHVLIVDQVSRDPFGLSQIESVSQCSRISKEMFNFSVIQSSSSFNGMGINRVHIQRMQQASLIEGLESYASQLCYRKFNQRVSKKDYGITILRHLLSKECQEDEIYLEGQSCLFQCST